MTWMRPGSLLIAGLLLGLFVQPGRAADRPTCPEQPETITDLTTCALQSTGLEQYKKAARWIAQASEQLEDLPVDHVGHAEVLNASAIFARSQRNRKAVLDLYRGMSLRLRETLGRDNPSQIDPLLMAARAAMADKRPDDGAAFLEEALRLAEQNRPGEGGLLRLSEVLVHYARHLDEIGRTEQSAAQYRRVAELHGWNPEAPWVAAALELARIEAKLGEIESAGRAYRTAVEMLRSRLGGGSELALELAIEFRRFAKKSKRPDLVKAAKGMLGELRQEPLCGQQLPEAAIRWTRRIAGPSRVWMSMPEYPVPARQQRVSGIVKMDVLVLADGTVAGAWVTDCSPCGLGFEEASLRAALQALFLPALQHGVPIDSIHEVTNTFDLR